MTEPNNSGPSTTSLKITASSDLMSVLSKAARHPEIRTYNERVKHPTTVIRNAEMDCVLPINPFAHAEGAAEIGWVEFSHCHIRSLSCQEDPTATEVDRNTRHLLFSNCFGSTFDFAPLTSIIDFRDCAIDNVTIHFMDAHSFRAGNSKFDTVHLKGSFRKDAFSYPSFSFDAKVFICELSEECRAPYLPERLPQWERVITSSPRWAKYFSLLRQGIEYRGRIADL